MGELVDALSLASAPGTDAIHHVCVPPVCMRAWIHADMCPEGCPGLAASLVSHRRQLLLLAWLAGGINPCREIIIGNGRDCRGLLVLSALRFPQHLSLLQQRFCLQREAPGRAAGLAWGRPSSAVPCTVPARVPARWLATLPGHGPELALEEPGSADVWELILGPSLS